MAINLPWAVLLCRYSDDQNDPNVTTIAQLAAQWRLLRPEVAASSLSPAWDTDHRTILELCQNFFTLTGIFTFNMVRYWDEMSHGIADTTGTEVFPCSLARTTAAAATRADNPGGVVYQNETVDLAKQALLQQHGKNWADFVGGVAVVFQSPDFGAQGGMFGTQAYRGPGTFMDIRFIRNEGTSVWPQEMGHAFGLDHSRTDGSLVDYTDPWDAMSTGIGAGLSTPDTSYGKRGPGLNAWNMRAMSFLDESRVWTPPPGDFNETITLRPLHKRNLPGFLAAELPGIGGHSPYLIEFRTPDAWDEGITWPKILVHREEDNGYLNNNSYLMLGTNGQKALGVGEIVEIGQGPSVHVKVESIDVAKQQAVVELCFSANGQWARSVEIIPVRQRAGCWKGESVSTLRLFTYLIHGTCLVDYVVRWSGPQTASLGNEPPGTGDVISVIMPADGSDTELIIHVTFADGTTATATKTISSSSESESFWDFILCSLNERKFPNPPWEWDPARLRGRMKEGKYGSARMLKGRAERLLKILDEAL